MYFSYAQLWLWILVRGTYGQLKLWWTKQEPCWDKTVRFDQRKQM